MLKETFKKVVGKAGEGPMHLQPIPRVDGSVGEKRSQGALAGQGFVEVAAGGQGQDQPAKRKQLQGASNVGQALQQAG